jgi:hypothetical protein
MFKLRMELLRTSRQVRCTPRRCLDVCLRACLLYGRLPDYIASFGQFPCIGSMTPLPRIVVLTCDQLKHVAVSDFWLECTEDWINRTS